MWGVRNSLTFTALLISVTFWYRQVSGETQRRATTSPSLGRTQPLEPLVLCSFHSTTLDSRVFPDRAEEGLNSVCHSESLGLLVTYPLRLLVM